MRIRLLGMLALLGAGVVPAAAQVEQVGADVRAAVAEGLELADFTIQRLGVPAEHGAFATEVRLGAVDYGLWVEPASFRSPGASASTVGAGGVITQIPLPAPLTVRAQVDGVPDARAAGSRFGGGLSLAIVLPGGEEPDVWTIQPLTDVLPGADRELHVVYRDDDVALREAWQCAVDDGVGQHQHAEVGDGGASGRAFLACELACEADWEYYSIDNNSSEPDTIADIDSIIARIAAIYEAECNVTFTIPHYNIWVTSGDPYTSSDPSTRLTQFRNWWNANKGGISRDLTHMFTGVNLSGSVIGIAYLSVVCNTGQGYGLVESHFTNGINARGALSAHEIGHNFSAQHCDGNGNCHIMCSGLGGCNGLGNPAFFGGPSATKITNYAANRDCLTEGGLSFPFFEAWESDTIDENVWPVNSGGVISMSADSEPSAPYSLNLDATDSIESGSLDLTNVLESPYFSFFSQHKGVENGKQIVAEYRDITGVWREFDTLTSDGADQTAFELHVYSVDVFGWGPDFAVRFRALGGDSTDDWYIDNIAVGPFPGIALPFHEPFAEDTLDTAGTWEEVSGASVSQAGDNEPSAPFAMNLDGTDSAATFNFLMSTGPVPAYLSFYAQHKGVESGKQLVIEYVNDFGDWTEFTTLTSDGSDQTQFEFHQASLFADAYHDGFIVRFRGVGADSTDDWYVDDIRLGEEFTPPDGCIADFNGDDTVNTQDVLAFLNAWNNGDDSADVNEDGSINTQDVLFFLNLWNAGC